MTNGYDYTTELSDLAVRYNEALSMAVGALVDGEQMRAVTVHALLLAHITSIASTVIQLNDENREATMVWWRENAVILLEGFMQEALVARDIGDGGLST